MGEAIVGIICVCQQVQDEAISEFNPRPLEPST
ncbi:uncharacterized protein CPUR_07522 [Claviceps purpurea 20.1]|uniref:Uncharacterized protein n=1 Tax=Claviceps purpurea (strain 20.1) TaxID=1111077 RepID=M1W4M2_CLAP2|nr:uncharacterized protein CPUR_07522 [Claviceps purpurea 20.1]